ncbi:Myblike DNAbinding domain-containing protein [Entomortierella beljakovae]|nr:Myblike DNAbinding domain-containing protein [Entomortierella beljakovae]
MDTGESSQPSGQEPHGKRLEEVDSIDMEDLFSDESDNDDLVDNEEELALLLKSQNLSIEELLPSKQAHAPAQDQLEKGVLAQDITPASHGHLGNLTLSATPTIDLELHSGDYILDASSSKGTSSQDTRETETQESFVSQDTYYREDEENIHDPTTNDDEEDDSTPTPVLVTPEENAQMTSMIREQAAKSLEVNREYQKTLLHKLEEVKQAYARNTRLRLRYRAAMEKHKAIEEAPVLLESTYARLGPPYFVDQDNNVPPDNGDTLWRKKRPLVVTHKAKSWTKEERENLKAGVISENKRLLFEMFTEEGDMAGIQSLDTAPDVQMMLNTKGIDWSRISQRFVDTRSASECLIRWTGHDHPGINKGEWSKEEIDRLDELAKKYNERNWIQIALDLDTNRTGAECFRKYQSRKTKEISRAHWTQEEDDILFEAVRLLGEHNWLQVSYYLENRSPGQCMYHWTKSLNPVIRRGRWLEEEDGALRAAIDVYGHARWIRIQEHILGRTDVQCRERYMNVLSPDVKTGPWTKEEGERLNELVQIHGETKWSLIASQMDGRTDNQCSRRYKMLCNERDRGRAYLSVRRRKGRTTLAQFPDFGDHKFAIRKAAAELRIKGRFEDALRRKRENEKSRITNMQRKTMQLDHDIFNEKQGNIFDLWDERWGKYVDPIEKVFNLGVPPISKLHQNYSREQIPPFDANVPDPASILRPGKVRPVPPCFATTEAFSKLLNQGMSSNGQFKLKHVIEGGNVVIRSPTTTLLTAQEQQLPEYKELMERFEAVFMWPMMMGMLNMSTAKQMIGKPEQKKREPQIEDTENEPMQKRRRDDAVNSSNRQIPSGSSSSNGQTRSQRSQAQPNTPAVSSTRPQQPLPRPRRRYIIKK